MDTTPDNQKQISAEFEKQRDLLDDMLTIARENNSEIRSRIDLELKNNKYTNINRDERATILQLLRDSNRELSKTSALNSFATSELREQKTIENDINKSKKLATKLNNEANQQAQKGNYDVAASLRNQADQVKTVTKDLENEKKVADNVNESFGFSGQALSAINKMTGGQFKALNDVLKTSKSQLGTMSLQGKLAKGTKGSMQALGVLGKNFATQLFKGKNIFLILLEAANRASNEINRFQKELGIGYSNAVALRSEFSLMAAKSGDLFINSKKLQEAFFELKNSVGFFFDTSSKASETFLNLNKRIGLAANEAANLTLLTRLQGKNTEEVTSNLFKGANAAGRLAGTTATAKDILSSAAKSSKGLQAALSASPGILIKAAAAAKAFGVELSSLESTQKSLLNFEQSIGAELEAELLTGRQLNLEKARLAALNNDLATVGEELKNQQIDLASFGNMNFIQQEKIANALGMSRDTLGDALLKQELQSRSLDEINEKFGKQTYEQAKALSAQDKMNALMESLTAVMGDIGVVLAPVLDLVASLLALVRPILQLVGFIAGGLGSAVSGITSALGIDALSNAMAGGLTTVNDAVLFNPEDKFSIVASTSEGALAQATSDISGGNNGISRNDLDYLISGINSKEVRFDSYSASGPQGIINTERRQASNLFA